MPEPALLLLFAGFAVGVLGHLAGSNRLVVLGIALISLGALLVPLLLYVAQR